MIQLDKDQQRAVEFASESPFAIITGGAGTGKTTIIRQLALELRRRGEDPHLCAFAGKAAARLKEATRFNATTIHRLLGANGVTFTVDSLEGKTIIVDESSMVASDLMAEVMRREPARVVLVGDPAQLPPVGKGQPFHDLITLRPETVVELRTCYRATEAVYSAASQIRIGETPPMHQETAAESFDIVATGDAYKTQKHILDWVCGGHVDFGQDIILCARNGGKKGDPHHSTVYDLNTEIVNLVNPRDADEKLRAGDRVINTKNMADKDVWNGTTGEVMSIDIDGGVHVRLDVPIRDRDRGGTDADGEPFYTDSVLFSREEAKNLHLAYALTVHKAQGSQYRRVIFVCLQRDSFALLDRSLIYTAVTRTQEHCVIAGQVHALTEGIQRQRPKHTVIQELATNK